MPYITSTGTNNKPVQIFYEDWGTGKPVILIHGWPVDHTMWEYQMIHWLPHHDTIVDNGDSSLICSRPQTTENKNATQPALEHHLSTKG